MPFDSFPVTSPVIETLCAGRARIEAYGFVRGTVEDRDGRVCTAGGITRQYLTKNTDMQTALNYLARAIPATVFTIGNWNDHPDRTKEDILAAYDRAIDLAIADQLNG